MNDNQTLTMKQPQAWLECTSNVSVRRLTPDNDAVFLFEESNSAGVCVERSEDFIIRLFGQCLSRVFSKESDDIKKAEQFLILIIGLSESGKIDEAIDEVIDYFEELLQGGDI